MLSKKSFFLIKQNSSKLPQFSQKPRGKKIEVLINTVKKANRFFDLFVP